MSRGAVALHMTHWTSKAVALLVVPIAAAVLCLAARAQAGDHPVVPRPTDEAPIEARPIEATREAAPAKPPAATAAVPRFRVAVIDEFYPGDASFPDRAARDQALRRRGAVDLDGDRVPDPYLHGDIVSLFLAHEGIEIVPLAVRSARTSKQDILGRLREIRARVFGGEPIDALVLSWESSTLISSFGGELDRARAGDYVALVREWGERMPTWRLSYEIIRALEDLTGIGVQVFTIAGNGGRHWVNTYSFADGVTTVGASDADPEGRSFASNVFVDTVAQAAYHVRAVPGAGAGATARGYDVDGDGRADVPLEGLSTHERPAPHAPRSVLLKGTSYAAPTALRRTLVAARARTRARAKTASR